MGRAIQSSTWRGLKRSQVEVNRLCLFYVFGHTTWIIETELPRWILLAGAFQQKICTRKFRESAKKRLILSKEICKNGNIKHEHTFIY